MTAVDTSGTDEDDQIYPAVASMDVYVRAWAGGGQLASISANGISIPLDKISGIGELKLGAGSALKNTTVDFDAAFAKSNPQADSAFLNIRLFQRQAGSTVAFNVQTFGPLAAPFNGATTATRETSVSII
jgi:hypothetical protein